ncbi:hypothetical protein ACFQHO_06150 [Actinomadura yumaensis]|uniref:hypothetical protein n=1 Tax=Actinomadura yumaensis TaxID=111807 RepID=UPI00361C7DFF
MGGNGDAAREVGVEDGQAGFRFGPGEERSGGGLAAGRQRVVQHGQEAFTLRRGTRLVEVGGARDARRGRRARGVLGDRPRRRAERLELGHAGERLFAVGGAVGVDQGVEAFA